MAVLSQIQKFISEPLTGILFSCLFGLAILRYQEKRKILNYEVFTETLIEKNLDCEIYGLKISYRDQPIRNLAKTRITIWNSGRSVIRKDDIPSKIRIFIKGDFIGQATLNQLETLKNNGFKIEYETYYDKLEELSNDVSPIPADLTKSDIYLPLPCPAVSRYCILIDFEYLAFRDGCFVDFFHTWDESKDVFIDGDIVDDGTKAGVSPPRRGKYMKAHEIAHDVFNSFASFFLYFAVIIIALYFINAFIFQIDVDFNWLLFSNFTLISFLKIITFVIFVACICVLYLKFTFRFVRQNKIVDWFRSRFILFFVRFFI